MTVLRQYRHFRNRISSLLCDDTLRVIWAYSRYLEDSDFHIPTDIEVSDQFLKLDHPGRWITQWDLEILAKEVVLNSIPAGYALRSLRKWSILADVINALKDFETETSGVHGENILQELYRIAHRQFTWQENGPITSLVRYHSIFNTAIINQICQELLGLSVEQVYFCGIALVAAYLKDPILNIPLTSDIPQLTADMVKKFLGFLCRPLPSLQDIMRREQKYDQSFFYAYNPLRAYPLIRMEYRGVDSLVCPMPTLLIWRFTAGLYYELYGDPRFGNAFGASFQAYVGRVISQACSDDHRQLETSKNLALFRGS